MNETPILSKKQQKASLSAKKTRKKETIRNVLATPFAKYWPLISEEQANILHKILTNHMPRIIPEKILIPGKSIKGVAKLERKEFRKKFREAAQLSQTQLGQKTGLIFGVNDVTKAIENRAVSCILIVADVQPKFMVEHLIDQSVLFRIPVLVVPQLRDVLKKACGFASVAIGFTDCKKYRPVQKIIENIYKKYPVPREHMNFQRSLDLMNSSVVVIDDTILEDKEVTENIADKEDVEPNIYLYRNNKKKRMFEPEKSCDTAKATDEMQVDSTGFLAFTVNPSSNIVKPKFSSLKVKKIRGNIDRNKRKIEQSKKRQLLKSHKKKRK